MSAATCSLTDSKSTCLRSLEASASGSPQRRAPGFFALWCIQHGASPAISLIFRRLGVTLDKFSPAHRELVPSATTDKEFRGIMSVYWIRTSYYNLTMSHDLAAILFVVMLGWNRADEWPPLVGNLMEAYNLRRFWGVFWHRLHVHPFMLYIPPSRYLRIKLARGAFISLWIFVMAALGHAVVNLVLCRKHYLISELRFFLLNWAVCLPETVTGKILREARLSGKAFLIKVVGHLWVFAVFFCIVPGWY